MSWPKIHIDQLCETIVDCVNRTAPVVDYPTPYKMIRTTNVKSGRIDLKGTRHVTEETFRVWTRRQVPLKGDIILTREAPLGEVGMIKGDQKVFLGQRLVAYRTNPAKLDRAFLLYSLQGSDLQGQIRAFGSGSTVEHMRVPDAKILQVACPPVDTQRRIGEILSAYDDLIENNTQRIAILEEIARRLFEEWFGEGAGSSEHSPVRLDALIDFDPRTTVEKRGFKPFLPMTAVVTNSMVVSHWEARTENAGSKFINGDTLLARITPCLENGKTAYVDFLPPGTTGFGSTEFIVMRGREVPPEFVYCLARSEPFREHAIKSMSGASGRQRVSGQAVAQFEMAQPDFELSAKFGEKVRPMFGMVRSLANANTNVRATRDILLPKLISGEIDVSAAEEALEAAAE